MSQSAAGRRRHPRQPPVTLKTAGLRGTRCQRCQGESVLGACALALPSCVGTGAEHMRGSDEPPVMGITAQTDTVMARKDGQRSAAIHGGGGMAANPRKVGTHAWHFRGSGSKAPTRVPAVDGASAPLKRPP